MSLFHKSTPPKPQEKPEKRAVPVHEVPDDEADQKGTDIPKEEWFHTEGQLTVDVYETDEALYIQAPVAGVRVKDIEVVLERDRITIRGKRSRTRDHKEANYFFRECYWGAFSRQIILPKEVNMEKAEAFFENGVLTVEIPKQEVQGTRKLEIKKR